MARRPSAKKKSPEHPTGSILQLKIRLLDVTPMIWRRILVPDTTTLEELHGVIQVAMGWESLHLYRFRIRAIHYGSLDLCVSSPRVPLDHFRFRKGVKVTYEYNMRDFWRHEIRVEDYLEPESGRPYPVCIDGAHACPPEACGGPGGYAERRQEACGFAAVDDLATLADLLEAAMVNGQADLLDASQRGWEAQEVVDRIRARQPFLTDTFSCSAVKARLRQGDHHLFRHQQLW